MSKIPKLAQVFMSKSGSSIDEHVGQIFIDIYSAGHTADRGQPHGRGAAGKKGW